MKSCLQFTIKITVSGFLALLLTGLPVTSAKAFYTDHIVDVVWIGPYDTQSMFYPETVAISGMNWPYGAQASIFDPFDSNSIPRNGRFSATLGGWNGEPGVASGKLRVHYYDAINHPLTGYTSELAIVTGGDTEFDDVKYHTVYLGGMLGPPSSCDKGACSTCGSSDASGSVGASLNSIHLQFGLGTDAQTTAGSPSLRLYAAAPSDSLFTPSSFVHSGNVVAVPMQSDVSLPPPPTEQYVSANTVVQVVDPNTNDQLLEFRFFARGSSWITNTDGTIAIPVSEVAHTTIFLDDLNASGNSDPTVLRVRRVTGTATETWRYSWNSVSNQLSLYSSTTGSSESLATSDLGSGQRSETRTTFDSNGNATSKVTSVYQTFPFGEQLVQQVVDPDGRNLISTATYYTVENSPGYGLTRVATDANGNWKFYQYDQYNRVVKIVSQRLNEPFADPPNEAVSNVTEHIFTPYEYSVSLATEAIVEKIAGVEVSRRYRVAQSDGYDEIVCLRPGVSRIEADNLTTEYRYFQGGEFHHKPKSVKRPDGVMTLYQYEMLAADGSVTTDPNLATVWKTVTQTGQASGSGTSLTIVAGSKTTTKTNRQGYTIETKIEDIGSGFLTSHSRAVAVSIDALGRPAVMEDVLTGRTDTTVYTCCDIESTTDRYGVTTTFAHTDTTSSETRLGVTTTSTTQGNTSFVTRTGTDGTNATTFELSRTTTNLAGEVVSTYSRGQGLVTETHDKEGDYIRHTTTFADGGTRIDLSYQSGAAHTTKGTSVAPMQFDEGAQAVTIDGVATNSRWRRQTLLDAVGAPTQEWSKSWTDMAGRTWKTESSSGAVMRSYYNNIGQLVKTTDADDVTTLYAYDAQGQANVTALDLDRDGVIDFNGKDRVTRTTRTFTTAHGTNVERTVQEVWATDDSDVPTTINVSERSLDGLQSWSTQGGLVTQRIEQPGAQGWNGNWSVSTIYPDDSAMVETYTNGRLASQVRTDANNVVIDRTDILYDAHGRVWKTTDGRGATTVQSYEQQANPVAGGHPVTADLVLTVQTPPKVAGGTGPVTTFHYDAMGRSDLVTDALNGTTTTSYYPTGKVQTNGGSRAYPISYTYTPQGRMETMTTTTAAGPSVTTWIYHPTSGLLQEKKIAGVTAYTLTHKPSGRPWTRTNARSVTTTYDYFDSGDMKSIDYADTTPDVAFTYTRQGQVKTTTSGGSVLTAVPNDFGQVVSESWSGGDLDGVSLTRSLDGLRRFGGLTVARSGTTLTSHTIGYDEASRVKTITKGTASATYAYIPQTSLPDSVTYKEGAATFATADHDFDLAGHLKWIKYTNAASAPLLGSEYTVDDIHRRTKVTREDGSRWDWGYNARSEVTSASRKFADATPAPMEQFSYTFDDIGNRLTSTAAGKVGTYVPNTKNQYTSRTNPGYVRVSAEADLDANVVINAALPDGRKGKEFWREQAVSNSSHGVLAPVRVIAAKPHGGVGGADIAALESGSRYVPPAAESFVHDDDGNLTGDGRWAYTWDAENRLTSAEEKIGILGRPVELPRLRLEFKYDATSRRTGKKVYTRNTADTAWDVKSTTLFIWDGWNLVAELESVATGPVALRRTYVWGLDVSGSLSGTGGVGGLVFETISTTANNGQPPQTSLLAPCYDGNGNVIGLLNTATGLLDARYEYDAFGSTLRATGVAANANPIRFSTKYEDVETGLVYYGFRYYSPELGRWPSRDPIGEEGGINLYGMVGNDPVNYWDYLGLLKVIIEHRRTVYGVFATYGELKVTVDDAEIASCCKLPMTFKALEPPTVIGRPIPSSATGHTKNEDTPPGGAYGRTSPQRFHNENPPAAPPGSNPNDYATGMNMELNIYAGKNVHAGINGNSSDGCIIIGSTFIETTLAGDPARQPGTVSGQQYSVPGFDYSDSVRRYTSLMESLACVRRNNKGQNLKVQYTRTDSGASRQQFNPTPQRPGAGRHENWNPNTDGVGVPAAIPVNDPRPSGGGFMRRLFNDISQIFRR